MSYDIYLKDAETGEVLELDEPHALRGGTYELGGTTECWLNVTYNYAKHFYRVLGDEGIRGLYGKTGEDTIPILDKAIAELGDDIDDDYWAATEGNAKQALINLWMLAKAEPEGVWDGD